MKRETLIEKLTKTAEGMRLYQQERAILEVTELLCELMDEQNVSRSALAERLGKTKGYITQLLDGRTNMTIRTISDVFVALNRAVHFQDYPLEVAAFSAPISWCPALVNRRSEVKFRLNTSGQSGRLEGDIRIAS